MKDNDLDVKLKTKILEAIELKKMYYDGNLKGDSEYYTVENLNNLYRFERTMIEEEQDEELIDFCLIELGKLQPPDNNFFNQIDVTLRNAEFNMAVSNEIRRRKVLAINKLKKVAAILAIIIVPLFTTQVVGLAFGFNLIAVVVDNVNQVLGLDNRVTDENEVREINYFLNWLPEGYKLFDTDLEDRDSVKSYKYIYSCPEKEDIILFVRIYQSDQRTEDIQVETDTVNRFYINGIEYIEADNLSNRQISWSKEKVRFTLYGKVSRELLKEIVEKNER